MAELNDVLQGVEGNPNHFLFYCPGCDEAHSITVNGFNNGMGASWQWNGSREKPTFSPSILVRNGHYLGVEHCWCKYNQEHPENPSPFVCAVCHSFVKDGMIQYLSDCTHKLAGQTVAMPTWKSWNYGQQ